MEQRKRSHATYLLSLIAMARKDRTGWELRQREWPGVCHQAEIARLDQFITRTTAELHAVQAKEEADSDY